jgi:hypothetical protein
VGTGGDEPRLLHRNLAHGYTSIPALAVPHEPECVTEAEQTAMTAAVHRRERERRVAAYRAAECAVTSALDTFLQSIGRDRQVAHAVRGVRRSMTAVGRQVGAA